MFLVLPLILFLGSLGAIIFIVSRKFVYLKKLSPDVAKETILTPHGFWYSFFIDFIDYGRKINLREQFVHVLRESERLLRMIRLFALKFESAMSASIQRVRTTRQNQHNAIKKQEEETFVLEDNAIIVRHPHTSLAQRQLREDEQRLIMSIAQDPKNPDLYVHLGDIYMKTGEYQDASESFKQALALRADDYMIKRKLDRVLMILQKLNI